MQNVIVAPSVRDLDVLASQLAGWLGEKMPEARDIRVTNLSYPFGAGRSHETILFDATWSDSGQARAQGYVVRIKPTKHRYFPDDLFEQQYRIMQLARETGAVPVARIFWVEPDPTLLGAPFFIMERLKGRVAVSIPPYRDIGWVAEATPAQRAKMWENGVRALAGVQKIPLASAAFLAGPEGARDGLAQEFDKYTRFIKWLSEEQPVPALEAGLSRLRALWPANQPPGVVWGDARIGNLMFGDNFEVLAVMDWEQPSLGGALNDLAWWSVIAEIMHGAGPGREHLAGMGTRADTIALWQELTGISAADLEWYEDFTRLKMSCLSYRTSAIEGAPRPDDRQLAERLKVSLPG